MNEIIQSEINSFIDSKLKEKGLSGYKIDEQEVSASLPMRDVFRLLAKIATQDEVLNFFLNLQLRIQNTKRDSSS